MLSAHADGTLTVIQADTAQHWKVTQTVKTGTDAHTMALNPLTHQVYLVVNDAPSNSGTSTQAHAAKSHSLLVVGVQP